MIRGLYEFVKRATMGPTVLRGAPGARKKSTMEQRSDRPVTVQRATKGPPGERIPPPPESFESRTRQIPRISDAEASKKLREGRNTVSPSYERDNPPDPQRRLGGSRAKKKR